MSAVRANRTEQYNPGLVEVISRKLLGGHKQPDGNVLTAVQDVYEVRPRKDGDGFDLICNSKRAFCACFHRLAQRC